MDKPILPIHEMNKDEFNNNFKRQHLDSSVLTETDLEEIKKVFGLSDRSANSPVGHLCCDEYHRHGYSCINYNSPEAGIVDRLIDEIIHYQIVLGEIRRMTHI